MSADTLEKYLWPTAKIFDAVNSLGIRAGYISTGNIPPVAAPPAPSGWDEPALDSWIGYIAEKLGIEAVATRINCNSLPSLISNSAPCIVRHPSRTDRVAAVAASNRKRLTLLGPDKSTKSVSVEEFSSFFYAEQEKEEAEAVESLFHKLSIPEHRKSAARKAMTKEFMAESAISGWWLLRLLPGDSVRKHLRQNRITRDLIMFCLIYLATLGLTMAGWLIIGEGALSGSFSVAWFLFWGALLLAQVPLSLASSFRGAMISTKSGTVFKKTLLYGALNMNPEALRTQGTGQFLGRVMDAEAFEQMAQAGAFIAISAAIEFVVASLAINVVVDGANFFMLALLWGLFAAWVVYRYYRHSSRWYDAYREMTNRMVERMIGHRTRLMQQQPDCWHEDEDETLSGYMKRSKEMDNTGILLTTIVQKGWLPFGLMAVAQFYLQNPAPLHAVLISVGCIMMIDRALAHFIQGAQTVIGIMNIWNQIEPLCTAAFSARAKNSAVTNDYPLELRPKASSAAPLLQAMKVSFSYSAARKAVLDDCNLAIMRGDRLLLEGSSGSGKSTLAAMLSGLRPPDSGRLLYSGISSDRIHLRSWRKKVVQAPQFHENHIFSETFGFNLLMGGGKWPPEPEATEEAEEICHELGLGDLLHKMPAGMQQQVGESGWRLSHGERSRVFIARALLQQPDLLILDESFAALDPENFLIVLDCVLKRAGTLLVIAHP
jgi:ATP-binding cassette subfamily B protein